MTVTGCTVQYVTFITEPCTSYRSTHSSLMDVAVTSDTLEVSDCRELGSDAIFTISSAKPGNGVEQLRDDNLETYWQSDGAFPHSISMQFLRKVAIQKVCLYLDYSVDESYTPKKITISCGTTIQDLYDVKSVELNEPVGWVTIQLESVEMQGQLEVSEMLRTHLLQVKVLSMHQNGRDTHIRQIKVFGPRESPLVMGGFKFNRFKTIEMQQYAVLR